MPRRVAISVSLALATLAGCATSRSEDDRRFEAASAAIGSCAEIDEEQVEHACLHGTAGPFRPVTASTTAPPDVSRPHTGYRVALEARPDGTFGGAVSFSAEEAGDHVVYTSAEVPQVSVEQSGAKLDFECTTSVPTQLCGALRELRITEFAAGEPAILSFERSLVPSVVLIIEEGAHHHDDEHDHAGNEEK